MVLLLPLRPAIPSLPFVMNRGLILWGESGWSWQNATGPSLDANPRASPEELRIACCRIAPGRVPFVRKAALLRQCEDLASGQPLRGPSDPEPGHADRPWDPVGQLEEFDRDTAIVML